MNENLIPILSAFIGGIIAIIASIIAQSLSYFFQKKHETKSKLRESVEEKYTSILIFMNLVLDPDSIVYTGLINDRFTYEIINNKSKKEISNYFLKNVTTHLNQILLYSNDNIIDSIKDFIDSPNKNKYDIVANNMKKHLWY